jgi:hypothetical protein
MQMHPHLTQLVAQQRMADLQREASRERLALAVAPQRRQIREHGRLARFSARFVIARA